MEMGFGRIPTSYISGPKWLYLLVHVVQELFVCMCKSVRALHETMVSTPWER